jgi:hypothetical protein
MLIRQSSFHAGEVAPNLFSRTDIPSRKYAVRSLRNFIPTVTGAALNRPGFKRVVDVKDQTRRPRLVPFTFSTSQAYLLEFGHLYVRVYQGGSLIIDLVTTYTEAELPQLQFVQNADTLTLTHPAHAPAELKRTGVSTWTLTNFSIVRLAAAPTGLVFQSPTPITTADDTHPVKPWDWVVTAVVNDEESLQSSAVSSTCQLAPDRTVKLSCNAVGGAQVYYWYRGRYGIYGYVGSSAVQPTGSAVQTFVDDGQVPNYSDKPPSQLNPFASSQNPATATYFQEREIFANLPSFPQRILFSKTGRLRDFDYSLPQKKSDAIDLTVASRMYEEIRGLVPLQQLVILTANTEYVIEAGDAPVAFDNYQLIPIGYNGSSWVRPLVIGDSILYVPPAQASVRELVFGGSNGWAAGDVSLAANHLLGAGGRTIVEWAFQKTPYSVAWVVRDDGSLVSLTYDPAFKVTAWAHHDSGSDTIESVACIPEGNEDVLYAVWHRGSARSIERLANRASVATASDGNFLDASVQSSGTTITGLAHLNGKTVYALRDGIVEGPFVVSGGSITLSQSGTKVFVGLAYNCDIELLDISVDPGDGQGDIGPDQKMVTRVIWEVDRTAGLTAGETFSDLIPWTAPLGYVTPASGLVNDLFVVPIDSSWNRYGRAVLRQSKPLPVSVIGVTRDVDIGGI